jgi:hypothetical protein
MPRLQVGLEGIISKRKDSPYRSGRSNAWLKSKTLTHRPSSGRLKRTGVADRRPQVIQRTLTQALWIALSGFRKLDDLPSDGFTNRVAVLGGGAERPKRHLEGAA